MKKFVFSLQSIYEYKMTVERTRKADLSQAQALLRALLEKDALLDAAFDNNKRSLERALLEKTGVARAMAEHEAYFRYLRQAKKELAVEIKKAEEEKDRLMDLVVEIMKEVKVYTKLREEQLRQYKEEVAAEEAKDVGDIVSYQAVTAEEQ